MRRKQRRRREREFRLHFGSRDLADVPGVPYSFAKCVALRESTNGEDPRAHGNIYGIEEQNGYRPGMTLAAQKRLFATMYAREGVQPWEPYDHC